MDKFINLSILLCLILHANMVFASENNVIKLYGIHCGDTFEEVLIKAGEHGFSAIIFNSLNFGDCAEKIYSLSKAGKLGNKKCDDFQTISLNPIIILNSKTKTAIENGLPGLPYSFSRTEDKLKKLISSQKKPEKNWQNKLVFLGLEKDDNGNYFVRINLMFVRVENKTRLVFFNFSNKTDPLVVKRASMVLSERY